MKTFRTWKTIKLGTGLKSGDDFRKALEAIGCRLGYTGTNDLLDSPAFTVAARETEVKLVNVSVAELGLTREAGTHLQIIYDCAASFGLAICPIEVGPQLRLQWLNQPKSEVWLRIAMEAITTKIGQFEHEREAWVFILWNRDDRSSLATIDSKDPYQMCSPDYRFVFRQRNH